MKFTQAIKLLQDFTKNIPSSYGFQSEMVGIVKALEHDDKATEILPGTYKNLLNNTIKDVGEVSVSDYLGDWKLYAITFSRSSNEVFYTEIVVD